MNKTIEKFALLAVCAVLGTELRAQPAFDSGSNGSYGVLAVNQNTVLDIPPDGVFHCTTITVASGRTLSFRRNALNTPVYLLATGDVTISGVIDVSGGGSSGAVPGEGGPGGFDGGFGGFGPGGPASIGGDGHGPGRGINATARGDAAHANAANQNTNVYGNVLIVPMIGGSGGAGGDGNPGTAGGGGGGAILVASNTKILVHGAIRSNGGFSPRGSGSGGSIRLVAPSGGGSGQLQASGQSGSSGGRVRLDTEDNASFRNYSLSGSATRGTRMFVFPPATPKLHIVEAAGTPIPAPASAAVNIALPANASPAQSVRIRGEGFTGNVPILLVVVPEHNASTQYELVLNAAANPAEVTANVTLPAGEPVRIEAWTR